MTMKIAFLDEPELEFGAGRHVDIRFGMTEYGPLDFDALRAPGQILVGLVGTTQTIEGVREWLGRCRDGIPARESRQPNLFPRFPGCTPELGLRTSVEIPDDLVRTLPKTELSELVRKANGNRLIEDAVSLFMSEVRYLCQAVPNIDAIVCALPMELLDAMDTPSGAAHAPTDYVEDCAISFPGARLDFHDLLKARAMEQRKPIQIVLPMTYDESKHRPRNQHRNAPQKPRRLQDEATRAWNFHTALYYKAGGLPWRLVRDSSQFTVCYVGVSFFRTLDGSALTTSVAQVFNERGEGVVVRGGAAQISKEDRQPHLSAEDAAHLLGDALARYREVHGNVPARVVIHKSSTYDRNELDGFLEALAGERVNTYDLLTLGPSSTKLFRVGGAYPPLRGTLVSLDDFEHVLYTRGSVDFFQTYPGMYVPVPLRVRCVDTEQTPRFLAQEILALTKMNWNNTQFDNAEPITLHAARQVGSILRYCPEGSAVEPRYSFYM